MIKSNSMASLQRVNQGTWLVHAGCVPHSAMLWTISGTESPCLVYRQSHQRSCCPDHSNIPNHQCTRHQKPRKPTGQIYNCGTCRHIYLAISWQQPASGAPIGGLGGRPPQDSSHFFIGCIDSMFNICTCIIKL